MKEQEQELELAISCLNYLTTTDEDRKTAGKDLGKLVKQLFIESIKTDFPQYDKEWLEKDLSVFVGTLRSDNHFGIFNVVSSHYKNKWAEMKFRIKETMIKDARNTIYNLETKWEYGSTDNFMLIKDGTGYIREASATEVDAARHYCKTPNVKEIIDKTVDETLNQFKDLGSTANAIKKLVKDNNCSLVILGNTLYLKKADHLIELN